MTTKSTTLIQDALLFVLILVGVSLLGVVIYQLSPVLTPFLIAAVLAYLTDPFVEFCCRKGKVPRTIPVIAVFLFVLLAMFLVLFFVIPALQHQFMNLLAKFPGWIDWFSQELLPQLAAFGITPDLDAIKAEALSHVTQASQAAKWIGQTLFRSSLAIAQWIMNLLIVFVATFYLLRDWRKILKATSNILPAKIAPTTRKLVKQCDTVLATFIRGQLTVMVCLAVLYSVGLELLGVNYSLLLGVMAGFLSIVPYLGSIVGLGASLIITHFQFHDWFHLLGVLGIFGIGHILEGLVLTPLLVGDKLGLHPVAVIFAVLAGGQLLGFVGVLIALPVAAILVVLMRNFLNQTPRGA